VTIRSLIRADLLLDKPLWILARGPHRLRAELREIGGSAWEVRLLHNGALLYAERHPTYRLTIEQAGICRLELESKGWSIADEGDGDLNPNAPFQLEWLFGQAEGSDQ
jgi:hypothetical protein